ncbi:hypothetical protein TRFO_39486 [Tritrichomonas foetus]|uniref:Uncharacterized protein n=1 Tax=Tritrichomonas foetus TaxID=1144522 RepID=A0A1J4J9E2_9EUKA|nr:hypothetical protein TRFO_39486 [Tritrichomonas foetus]|eukprot:OHS94299.1 hypothetical protein TRFO_39486 [Tritrichomonas foetus]
MTTDTIRVGNVSLYPFQAKLLPKDLESALRAEPHTPKTAGRKSAIDEDNVLDFACFSQQKKLFGSNQLEDPIKGTGVPPLKYAINQRKYKCIAYIILKVDYEHFQKNSVSNFNLSNIIHDKSVPDWFPYIYAKRESLPFNMLVRWDFAMKCPHPIDCLDIILEDLKKSECNRKKVMKNPMLDTLQSNPERDAEFFQRLSSEEIDGFLNFMKNYEHMFIKPVNFEIKDLLFHSGRYEEYIYKVDPKHPRAEYVGRKSLFQRLCEEGKKEEFKKIVDKHPDWFEDMWNFDAILSPENRDVYPYAYKNTQFNDRKVQIGYEEKFVNKIIGQKWDVELQYLVNKGMIVTDFFAAKALRTLDKKIINILEAKIDMREGINRLISFEVKNIKPYLNLGYQLNEEAFNRFPSEAIVANIWMYPEDKSLEFMKEIS